jgi:plasmid replication initiation protein
VIYSPTIVSATTYAIRLALGTPEQGDPGRALHDAVQRLCADARRLGMRPEELVVLVKMTWRTHPAIIDLPRNQASHVLDHIVSMCIEEYFRTTVAH